MKRRLYRRLGVFFLFAEAAPLKMPCMQDIVFSQYEKYNKNMLQSKRFGYLMIRDYRRMLQAQKKVVRMDQKAIETLSVNAVRDRVVISDFLDQFIADNDKEPSFDGFVYLYSEKGKKKENLIGRISVQVKGTQKKLPAKNASTISHPLEIVDLRNYLADGGAVYFVVHISDKGQMRRIFYNDLLPIKIMKILEQTHEQKEVSLKFKPFPIEPDRVHAIFISFYEHKQKQAVLHDLKEIPSVDDLQKRGLLREINLSVAGTGLYRNHIDAFLNEDVYVYAKVIGTEVYHPVDLITNTVERVISHEKDNRISVNDALFYEKYNVLNYAEKVVLEFGQSVTLTFPRSAPDSPKQKATISYTACPSLSARANNLAFWVAFIEAEGFQLNNSFISFPLEPHPSDVSLQKAKNELTRLRRTIAVFDELHITDDIDLTKLSEADWREINILARAILDKEPIKGLQKDLPFSYRLTIGDVRIALVHTKLDEDGTGEVFDFFSGKFIYGYTVDEIQHLAPPCATMDKEGWEALSNINYADVFPSFERIYKQHNDPEIFAMANNTLLAILLAYDSTHKDSLLNVSVELAGWIMQECSETILPSSIRLINSLQVSSRSRDLNKKERLQLQEIAEDTSEEERIRVGAYLLLKNQDAAELHFQRMDEDLQKSFREWPIYHFWKKT
jgi:hypothetical protein